MLITIIIGMFISIILLLSGSIVSIPLIILISFLIYKIHKKIITKLPEEKISYELLHFFHCFIAGITFGAIGYYVHAYLDFMANFISNLFN